MKVMCGWCGKDMGAKEPYEQDCVSHGICEPCHQEQLAQLNFSCNDPPEPDAAIGQW